MSAAGQVHGDVLEVGSGTGRNFPYFDAGRVRTLTLLDPRPAAGLSQRRARRHRLADRTRQVTGRVEALPFRSGSFDAVLVTLVFCSVEDPVAGARELFRTLRPGGIVRFVEHVRPPKERVARWFDRLTPAWRRAFDNCRLNRCAPATFSAAGFRVSVDATFRGGVFVCGTAERPRDGKHSRDRGEQSRVGSHAGHGSHAGTGAAETEEEGTRYD